MGLLDGKVVLVTGAGGGIGRCHALACARLGARVVVNDLGGAVDGTGSSGGMADRVTAEIEALGEEAMSNCASVTDYVACEEMVAAALERWGRIDVVVNNAGILRDKTFAKMSPQEWDIVVEAHLTGTRNVTRAALDALKANGGSIVNTTSYSGMIGNFGQSNYGAAKAGIYGFSRVLALELRKYGVRVNCVAPVAKTRMTENIDVVAADWGPEQISPIVTFLASDLSKDVTGQVFGVQGQRIHLYEVKTNDGVEKAGTDLWTPEEIAASFGEITAWSSENGKAPLSSDSGDKPMPIGKEYQVGDWPVQLAEIHGYAAATNDDNPAYEGDDVVAPPMYHVKPFIGLMQELAGDPELEIDHLRLVHGEHAMRFHRPIRPGDAIALRGTLKSVDVKSSGTLFAYGLFGYVGGELALEGRTSYFIRGEKKPGQKRAPRPPAPALPAPDWTCAQPVTEDQAIRYAAASGDGNPIHTNPDVAKAAGLPGCILHGLCSMAFATRDIVDQYCGGDPNRLASVSVRFARPVFPGETLTLKVWQDGDQLSFLTENADGKVVISNGTAEIRSL